MQPFLDSEEQVLLGAWKLEEPDRKVVEEVLAHAARVKTKPLRRIYLPVAATLLLLVWALWAFYTRVEAPASWEEVLLVQEEPEVVLSWEVPQVTFLMARTRLLEQQLQGQQQPVLGVYTSMQQSVSPYEPMP